MARPERSAPEGTKAAATAGPTAELRVMAARLRSLRRDRRMTQELFAATAGISVSFVSMLERGERSPSYETLLQLAQGFDVPVSELFRSSDERYDDSYFRTLVDFARAGRLTRRQIDRLVVIARALFDLGHLPLPRRKAVPRRRELPGCTVTGCQRRRLARGLCAAHYHAERRRRAAAPPS